MLFPASVALAGDGTNTDLSSISCLHVRFGILNLISMLVDSRDRVTGELARSLPGLNVEEQQIDCDCSALHSVTVSEPWNPVEKAHFGHLCPTPLCFSQKLVTTARLKTVSFDCFSVALKKNVHHICSQPFDTHTHTHNKQYWENNCAPLTRQKQGQDLDMIPHRLGTFISVLLNPVTVPLVQAELQKHSHLKLPWSLSLAIPFYPHTYERCRDTWTPLPELVLKNYQ